MSGRRSRSRSVAALASLVLAALSIACIDITVDTKALGSVEVASRGTPGVVAGDTMRDSAGKAIPLDVRVYDAGGDIMSGRTITYVVLDTAMLSITPSGYVIGRRDTTGTGRAYAVVDKRLQSLLQTFTIVPRPDSAAPSGVADTVKYRQLLNDPYDTTKVLGVKILSGTTGVPKWIVTFSLRKASTGAVITDTTRYAITKTDSRRVSSVDTSDASGEATRRVRVVNPFGTLTVDTLELVVRATYKGVDLKGSPRVIPIVFKPAT